MSPSEIISPLPTKGQANANKTVSLIDFQREQAQEDIRYILDGLDEDVIDRVCQVIVDRFNILK
jgi:hypothetical protein